MIGWPVSSKWAVACLFGLVSQQPVRPHTRHWRRWSQGAPIATQAWQTSSPGPTSAIWSRWVQVACIRGPYTDGPGDAVRAARASPPIADLGSGRTIGAAGSAPAARGDRDMTNEEAPASARRPSRRAPPRLAGRRRRSRRSRADGPDRRRQPGRARSGERPLAGAPRRGRPDPRRRRDGHDAVRARVSSSAIRPRRGTSATPRSSGGSTAAISTPARGS